MEADVLVRSGPVTWDIPVTYRADMRVPARIYASPEQIEATLRGEALTQLVNVATLPGIVGFAYGMPDMHDGYGFPVGGVAATRLPDGVVSPGGVGFDINCGVRLLVLPLTRGELAGRREALVHEMSRAIPSGVGRGGDWVLDDAELDQVLTRGSRYLVEDCGLGFADDLRHCESGGALDGADARAVSPRARDRGRGQLGTMGSGNHFVELQCVERVLDRATADAFGLDEDQVTVLIHTGSRGLGHQVCTDFVRLMDEHLSSYGFVLPDRQLSCAPASSPEGRRYLAAMAAAANYAWGNRQMITRHVRGAVARILTGTPEEAVRVLYDVAHNIAKPEEHGGERLCVHRKGATRAFGPGHPELPPHFQATGQPVFIPGSMGTASWVLAGLTTSDTRSWGSACHGAGRQLSRTAARRSVSGSDLRRELESHGIVVRCASARGLAEEAPLAYKDVDAVTDVVEQAGLARRVARLVPLGVVKA